MSTKETTKTKQGLGVQFAEQILEEGKRPMSLDEIKGKYQLNFPFTVVRVVRGSVEPSVTCSCTDWMDLVGAELTFINQSEPGYYDSNVGCAHSKSDSFTCNTPEYNYRDGGVG